MYSNASNVLFIADTINNEVVVNLQTAIIEHNAYCMLIGLGMVVVATVSITT